MRKKLGNPAPEFKIVGHRTAESHESGGASTANGLTFHGALLRKARVANSGQFLVNCAGGSISNKGATMILHLAVTHACRRLNALR